MNRIILIEGNSFVLKVRSFEALQMLRKKNSLRFWWQVYTLIHFNWYPLHNLNSDGARMFYKIVLRWMMLVIFLIEMTCSVSFVKSRSTLNFQVHLFNSFTSVIRSLTVFQFFSSRKEESIISEFSMNIIEKSLNFTRNKSGPCKKPWLTATFVLA